MENNSIFKNPEILNPSTEFRRVLPFKLFIPIQTTDRSTREQRGFKLRFNFKGNTVRKHLIWRLLYKGVDVMEWFILFQSWNLNKKSAPGLEIICQYGLLLESAKTRNGLVFFKSRMKPLFRQLRALRLIGSENSDETFLNFITSVLGVPEKGLPPKSLYSLDENIIFRYPTAIEPNFIGVGYKDKGSMGGDIDVFDALEDEILDFNFNFEFPFFRTQWLEISEKFTKPILVNSPPNVSSAKQKEL